MTYNNLKYKVLTVGCPVNQSESEALKNIFEKQGVREAKDGPADIYIINTCTVTQAAAKKSRKKAKYAIKENENAVIAMMGCYGEIAKEEIEKKVPEVDIIIGTKDRKKLANLTIDLFNKKKNEKNITKYNLINNNNNVEEKDSSFEELGINYRVTRKRPVVKIQEGCNQTCSFCIVTIARGKPKSRKINNIKSEIKYLVFQGYKEIILAGTNMGLYGFDLKKDIDLSLLLEELALIKGDFRIRLSSLEPVAITEDVLYTMKENKKVCNHLYLPLQSGSEKILELMKRNYTREEFAWVVDRSRTLMPDVSIISDIIVGFPGETENDHYESINFIKSLELDKLHVFPYSPRPKTKAAKFEKQVRPDIKERRVLEMKELNRELSLNFHSKQIGKTLKVLAERYYKSDDCLLGEGFSENYAFTRFRLPQELDTEEKKNEIINKVVGIKILEAYSDKVVGELKNFLY